MAQLFSTGPAHVFITVPAGGGVNAGVIAYLGTCEDSPRIILRPSHEPVMNALSGSKVPLDLSDQSEEAFIGLDLTRWNQGVLNSVRGRSVIGNAAGSVASGRRLAGDIGTLALTENAEFGVTIVFPFVLKPVMAGGGLPAGYAFGGCVPVGPDDLGPLSTRARKENLMFHAIPVYSPIDGSFTLYSPVIGPLPPIN